MRRHSVMRLIVAVVLMVGGVGALLQAEVPLGLVLLGVAVLFGFSAVRNWNKDENDRR